MNYDTQLADRVRQYLIAIPGIDIEEKKMFRGLTFMVNALIFCTFFYRLFGF